jgi:acyl dehydratase
MSLPVDTLGARPPRVVMVDRDQVLAYAAATNDDNPAYLSGRLAPPVYGVVPAWDPLIAAVFDIVPPDKKPVMLHANHDMRFSAPIVPGTTLSTVAQPFSVRPSRAGTWVTVRAVSVDADTGVLVLEQYGTMFVRGWADVEGFGPDRFDHSFPSAGRTAEPVAVVEGAVDPDQTWRYAAASGDDNRIHTDDEFARGVGLPGIILHGLCTMAMCGRAVIEGVAGGDPTRLTRLAIRFSKPVLPASDLVTTIYPAGGDDSAGTAFGFEATSRGERVIRDGRAELG